MTALIFAMLGRKFLRNGEEEPLSRGPAEMKNCTGEQISRRARACVRSANGVAWSKVDDAAGQMGGNPGNLWREAAVVAQDAASAFWTVWQSQPCT